MNFLQFITRTHAEQKIRVSGYTENNYFEIPIKTAYEFWINNDIMYEIQNHNIIYLKSNNDIINLILDNEVIENE